MDKATASSSLSTTVSSKKLPFSSVERELIVALVRERPVLEDKRTHAKNIELKKRAWEDLTVAYNSQPYVSQRLTQQLKRCWENIKTQRKKELLQESMSLKRTVLADTMEPDYAKKLEPDNGNPTIADDMRKPHNAKESEPESENYKKKLSETDARIKRTSINIQQDQALHELRLKREKILIARETNLLEYEKTIHELQIKKAKLEIEMLIKQIGNKSV